MKPKTLKQCRKAVETTMRNVRCKLSMVIDEITELETMLDETDMSKWALTDRGDWIDLIKSKRDGMQSMIEDGEALLAKIDAQIEEVEA